jgi:hypothetical protein
MMNAFPSGVNGLGESGVVKKTQGLFEDNFRLDGGHCITPHSDRNRKHGSQSRTNDVLIAGHASWRKLVTSAGGTTTVSGSSAGPVWSPSPVPD